MTALAAYSAVKETHDVREMMSCNVALQVAFNMFIPCMLFTKVASTLAAQPELSLLAIPALAIAQVRPGSMHVYSMEGHKLVRQTMCR